MQTDLTNAIFFLSSSSTIFPLTHTQHFTLTQNTTNTHNKQQS